VLGDDEPLHDNELGDGVRLQTIRVVIADDHELTRGYIRETLEADGGFLVCAEAIDAPGAVEAALRERPDLCLLDVMMPGGGIAAAWEISSRLRDTRIVMLTASQDQEDLFAALRAGALGYLVKDMDPARIPHALRDVVDGEAALPRRLVARLIDEFRDEGPRRRKVLAQEPFSTLTSREWQVLDLLRQGFSTGEIADRLMLSPVTVRTHVHNALRKVRAPDRETLLTELNGS
jgi:DNA-binding NarL/FixJ family response regulator